MTRRTPTQLDLTTPPSTWLTALRPHAPAARQLIAAFNRQALRDVSIVTGDALAPAAWAAAKAAVGALHRLFAREFGEEINVLADVVGVAPREVLAANLAYDLSNGAAGCTTLAVPTAAGPLHARNLDWHFPGTLLRRKTLVTRRAGPCGPYLTVGWPGFFGALTAVAKGRFSVSVNYVTHATHSGLAKLAKRAVAGYWPVPWAVRGALDDAETFEDAVAYLHSVPLLSPTLLVLTGTRNSERALIERTPDKAVVTYAATSTKVTHHSVARKLRPHNVDLSDLSTEGRYWRLRDLLLRRRCSRPSEALSLLSHGDLLDETTAHQVVMTPRTGDLVVRVRDRAAMRFSA